MIIRLSLGYAWRSAGWGKLTNPAGAWVGVTAGTAISGFLKGALAKTTGDHPDVSGWYATFLQQVALPMESQARQWEPVMEHVPEERGATA